MEEQIAKKVIVTLIYEDQDVDLLSLQSQG